MELLPIEGKTFVVHGLARSGMATVKWILERGGKVIAMDTDVDKQSEAIRLGATTSSMDKIDWSSITALVQSPGIPLSHPLSNLAKRALVNVIGDCDLFRASHMGAKVVGITGTNGKSTTTTLVGHILSHAGIPVAIGGNVGVPVLSLPDLPENGVYVLELSSYQLEISHGLCLNYAGWLNITPDHLDRHGSMIDYVHAKSKIFSCPQGCPGAVISVDDEWSHRIFEKLKEGFPQQVTSVSCAQDLSEGIFVRGGRLFEGDAKGGQEIADLTKFSRLSGVHNHQNMAVAYGLCRKMGLSAQKILEGISTFPGLHHRQEWVGEKDGITFVNDSKATNAEATARALETFSNIYWIVGGQAKSDGIESLKEYFPKIRHVFLIGSSQDEFAQTINNDIPTTRSGDIKLAVAQAYAQAKSDAVDPAVVLLSPSCASFDQFRDFEHRGDYFKTIVHELDSETAHKI